VWSEDISATRKNDTYNNVTAINFMIVYPIEI
jgi:hypothetical protein